MRLLTEEDEPEDLRQEDDLFIDAYEAEYALRRPFLD